MAPLPRDTAWFGVVCAAVFVLAAGACKDGHGRQDSALDRGRSALNAGRPAEAVPFLEKAVRARPGRLGARRLLAKAFVALGRLSKAREVLSRGAKVSEKGDPERYPLLLDLADVLVRQGRYGDAAGIYGQAIEERPDQVVAYWRLGELYEMNRQWRDARATYEHLLHKGPGGAVTAEVRLRMARCALHEGRLEAAMQDAMAGLSLPNAAPRVRAGLELLAGRAAMEGEDWKAATAHLRRALRLGSPGATTWPLLAGALVQSEGCSKPALAALRKAAGGGGDLTHKELACLAGSADAKDRGLALLVAQKADRKGRLDRAGKILLARLYLQAGQADRALDILDALAASKGRLGPKIGLLRARSLAALGRHSEAFDQFSRLVAQGSQDSNILRGQALEAVWSGRYGAAARLLKPLVRQQDQDPELLTALAVALGGLGRSTQARRMLESAAAVARKTRDARALERVLVYSAWLDLRTRHLHKALETSRALAARPGPFQLHALDIQAQVLLRLGRKAEAARVIQQALKLHLGPERTRYFNGLLFGIRAQSSPDRSE